MSEVPRASAEKTEEIPERPEATVDQPPQREPDVTEQIQEPGGTLDFHAAPAPSPTDKVGARGAGTFRDGPEKTGGGKTERRGTRAAPADVPQRIGAYEILGTLGQGGMGVVYKARHSRLDRIVALKMILTGAHATQRQLARFQQESQAVAQLHHPNIVELFEIGEHNQVPYFSLEFVPGGDLADRCAGRPQPPRDAARVVEALARAMESAHERGIVHRDLKPANVLLTADGIPKITDFGLAKRLEADSGQTAHGTLMGTPSYMAPEQARAEHHETTPRTDVYALGAILYELITGRPPFESDKPLQTVMKVLKEEATPPPETPAKDAARPGNDLSEVPAEGSCPALRQRCRPGRRLAPLSGQ
jgi:serine/threonine protein kinase